MSCIIKRILTINIPIGYKEIVILDENSKDITTSCMFSWSTDKICWTSWITYTEYQRISPNIESDFYLRVLLFGSFSRISLNNSFIECFDICLYNENPYLTDLCQMSNFDIYSKLDCALLLQQQLSDLICCMIGIPCYYFRVSPQNNTADYSFKEYILHNIDSVKYIKLVLQDGQLPSSRPQMTEFDFDWDNDWEVEIGKTMFANAFGDKVFPKQRDMIYVPMMNRMYEVNSAYDEKQDMLLWRATTWKLGLVKWTDKSNIDKNDFEDTINSLIDNNFERDFFSTENKEQERISGVTQTEQPTHTATNLLNIFISDFIRKYVTESEKDNIIDRRINHGSIVVTRNFYNFKGNDSQIIYQNKYCGDSGELLFIISLSKNINRDLFSIGSLRVVLDNFDILFNNSRYTLKRDTIYSIICKWNRSNFTTELIIKELKHPEGVPEYRLKSESYKFDDIYTNIQPYNNDYIQEKPVDIIMYPGNVLITNIKIFNKILQENEETLESVKYSTTNENCILNDVSRPIEVPHGFDIK